MTKAWVNSFGRIRNLVFEKMNFFKAKKGFFSIKNIFKILFLVLFWPKTNREKSNIFWQKAWVNLFGKIRNLVFERMNFFMANKGYFSFYKTFKTLFLVLFWLKKKLIEKKNTFFGQKHGLIPLEKLESWSLTEWIFLWLKKVSFRSRTF